MMHKRVWRSVAGLVAVNLLVAAAAGQGVELGQPIELPRCGITISVPVGCEPRPLAEPHQLLLAIEMCDDQRVLGVTLSAFPVGPEMTPDEFADVMISSLHEQLVVRNMEATTLPSIDAAGLEGAWRRLRYDLRGQQTVAASVCFIRPLEGRGISICYVLTVEASADQCDEIQQVLEAVVATVSFQPIQPPSLAGCGEPGEPVKMHELGFSIRPPRQWFAAAMPTGVQMGQVDYTLGGQIMPAAQVNVTPLQADDDASACARVALSTARQIAEEAGLDVEVVSQGPAVMAGQQGYQFVLRQRPRTDQSDTDARSGGEPQGGAGPKDAPGDVVVIIQRVICVAAPEERGGRRSYSLTLVCQGDQVEPVEVLMDSLAEGFELIPIAGADGGDEPAAPVGDAPSESPAD